MFKHVCQYCLYDTATEDDLELHVELVHLHKHSFIIPVEWAYKFTDDKVILSGIALHPQNIRVTKLRCDCGQEVSR